MKIQINGYFDRNFGDDMMIRTIASQLPEHDFYIASAAEVFTPFATQNNIHRTDEELPDADAKALIIGAGFQISGMIPEIYALYEYFGRKRSKKHPKTAIIGCSIGTFRDPLAKFLMADIIRQNSLITCRDRYSEEFLKKVAKRSAVKCHPDILFGLDDKLVLPKTGENCVGITLACPQSEMLETYCERLSRLADRLTAAGKKVLLFCFDVGRENDIKIAKRITELCERKELIETISHTDDGTSIMQGFSRCSFVVCTRFHSVVLSLVTKTPFAAVSYNPKTVNMLCDIGYTGKVYDINSFDPDEIFAYLTSGISPAVVPEDYSRKARLHSEDLKNWLEGTV